jgi:hypothetical protein
MRYSTACFRFVIHGVPAKETRLSGQLVAIAQDEVNYEAAGFSSLLKNSILSRF